MRMVRNALLRFEASATVAAVQGARCGLRVQFYPKLVKLEFMEIPGLAFQDCSFGGFDVNNVLTGRRLFGESCNICICDGVLCNVCICDESNIHGNITLYNTQGGSCSE